MNITWFAVENYGFLNIHVERLSMPYIIIYAILFYLFYFHSLSFEIKY